MTKLYTNLRRGTAIALAAATLLSMTAISTQAGSVSGGFGSTWCELNPYSCYCKEEK